MTTGTIMSRGLAAAVLITALVVPTPAEACGALFVGGGQPGPAPLTAANVLFVRDGAQVQMHVQLRYTGDPARFAWIIPLPTTPELSVGSDALFDRLLDATTPTYQVAGSAAACAEPSAAPPTGSTGSPPVPGPQVLLTRSVGAFDITVIGGTNISAVASWLQGNDYQASADVLPALVQYLDEGATLVAIELSPGSGFDEIHPIVLRYPAAVSSIPLRLSRIAAADDMELRVFALGDARVVPGNYRHVVPNPLQIDWLAQGTNDRDVVSHAVDADPADGRAFVTEYAGSSDVVPGDLRDPRWNADVFISLADYTLVLDELVSQGLVSCFGGPEGCLPQHPLVEGLLTDFLLTDSITIADLWNSPLGVQGLVDWRPLEFAEAMQSRIIDPAQEADDLLARWPYLTRLRTRISADEMTFDPLFHENADLPDVAANRTTQRVDRCDGDAVFTFADGRELYLPAGEPWPDFGDDMPWAEQIQAMPPQGAAEVLVDNRETIDERLHAYNDAQDWPRGCQCHAPGPGGPASGLGWLLLGLRRRPGGRPRKSRNRP
jgi:hypothetical protein